jgi:hypothetical protein
VGGGEVKICLRRSDLQTVYEALILNESLNYICPPLLQPALNISCGSVEDFECGNGDCINYSLTCDGMAHCKDKSDEKQSYCGEALV